MKTSRKTAGVTLVVTVLIVMLLLAGVVVVTGQLALSARKSGVDQEATIRAQYVAESGVARGQARLRQARSILSTVAIAQNGTTQASLKALFAQFCTVSLGSVGDLVTTVGTLAVPATLCTANMGAGVISTAGDALNSNIAWPKDGSGNIVYPAGWTAATWPALFSTAGLSLGGTAGDLSIGGALKLRPVNVVKQGIDDYLLNMQIVSVESTGSSSTSSRSLRSDSPTSFTLRINRPPFSTYAQFRNQTTATSSNGGNALYFAQGESFNGPVHTNSTLRLSGPTGPTFQGDLSTSTGSAGSPSIDFNNITAPCNSLTSIQTGACSSMYPGGSVSYPHYISFIPLPLNNNDQVRASLGLPQMIDPVTNLPTPLAATEAPLALGLNPLLPIPSGVYYSKVTSPTTIMGGMYVQGDADVKLSTTSATPRLQMIDITQPPAPATGGVITHFEQTAGGIWTVKKGSGPTTNVSGTFNGMLYVNGNVNMSGDGSNSPDIASNSALTVSNTNGDIKLKTSMTYAECPLVPSASCPAGSTANADATNVLGFFSSNGSVLLDGPDGSDMNVNATVLASTSGKGFGSVHYNRSIKTNINLIGGIIEDQSQTVSAGTNDGYTRKYVYDPRFKDGYSPPFFPLQQRWEIIPSAVAQFDVGTIRQKQ